MRTKSCKRSRGLSKSYTALFFFDENTALSEADEEITIFFLPVLEAPLERNGRLKMSKHAVFSTA